MFNIMEALKIDRKFSEARWLLEHNSKNNPFEEWEKEEEDIPELLSDNEFDNKRASNEDVKKKRRHLRQSIKSLEKIQIRMERFHQNNTRVEHVLCKGNIRRKLYTCPYCSGRKEYINLSRHLTNVHKIPKLEAISYQSEIRARYNYECKTKFHKNRPLKCFSCKKWMTNLKRHLIEMHKIDNCEAAKKVDLARNGK